MSTFFRPILARSFHLTANNLVHDYYAVLGVSKKATAKEIKTAYYDKAKVYHPDATKESSEAKTISAAKFQEISEAYEVLGNEQKRRFYDSTLSSPQHSVFGQTRRDTPSRPPRRRPAEPISMNHLQHVYKTLNRTEHEEIPKYGPLVNHNYPDSEFNRFEYSRFWDPHKMTWVYQKKTKESARYAIWVEHRHEVVRKVVFFLVMGTMGLSLYNHFIYIDMSDTVKPCINNVDAMAIQKRIAEDMEAMRKINRFDE